MARTRKKDRLVRVATYNVRTLAVKRANGYGQDFSVLYEAARLDISVVGLQETKRAGRTEFEAAGFRVFCCGSEEGLASRGGVSRERVDLQQLHRHH